MDRRPGEKRPELSGSQRYQVVVVPDARREIEGLPPAAQDAVLESLQRDLDKALSTAKTFEVDGRRYFETTIAEGFRALFRPLATEEVELRIDRGMIDDAPRIVFLVVGLERPNDVAGAAEGPPP